MVRKRKGLSSEDKLQQILNEHRGEWDSAQELEYRRKARASQDDAWRKAIATVDPMHLVPGKRAETAVRKLPRGRRPDWPELDVMVRFYVLNKQALKLTDETFIECVRNYYRSQHQRPPAGKTITTHIQAARRAL
jgi:hypothetical protein